MFKFSKFTLLSLAVVFTMMTACKKGDPVNEYYFASFSAELLALPGTITLDVYVGDTKIDTLAAGESVGVFSKLLLSAGKPSTIYFKKAGTDTVLLDTTVSVSAGENVALRLAYSPTLGIQSFMQGSDANVGADSTLFFLFNAMPEELVPDSVTVDAYLFKSNNETGQFEETGITWPNLEKNKLHTNQTTILVTDETGTPITYAIKLKNVATGEFIKDAFNLETISLSLQGGSRQIITLTAYTTRNKLKFTTSYATY